MTGKTRSRAGGGKSAPPHLREGVHPAAEGDEHTLTIAGRGGEGLAGAGQRRERPVQRVGGELGRVAVARRQPTELFIDLIRADRGSLQDRAAIGQLGYCCGRGAAGGAALGVLADAFDRGAVQLE